MDVRCIDSDPKTVPVTLRWRVTVARTDADAESPTPRRTAEAVHVLVWVMDFQSVALLNVKLSERL